MISLLLKSLHISFCCYWKVFAHTQKMSNVGFRSWEILKNWRNTIFSGIFHFVLEMKSILYIHIYTVDTLILINYWHYSYIYIYIYVCVCVCVCVCVEKLNQ